MKKNKIEGKLPPQAVEVEEAVLGAILLDKLALIKVRKILTENTFYNEAHKLIFRAASELAENHLNIDLLTVINKLKEYGKLEEVGGAYFVSQLTNKVASSANLEQHAYILKEKELKRLQIELGSEIIEDGYDLTVDALSTNEKISLKASELLKNLEITQDRTVVEIVRDTLKEIEAAKNKKGITGLRSGINHLDHVTNGWQPADLIYIAARPAMGKTALVLNMCRNICVEEDRHVAFFSLEMESTKLMLRLIALEANVEMKKLRSGLLDVNEIKKLQQDIQKLTDSKLHLFDKVKNIHSIKNKCLELHMKGELDIIVIDYLQLIRYPRFEKNREQEVSQVSRELKQIGLELGVPVICLSQLSREVEKRADKKPQLSDLRDSGSIEQDADIVMFLFRPEYYKMEDAEEGLALVLIRKHRNGELATIKMRFNPHILKFENWNETNNEENKNKDLPF